MQVGYKEENQATKENNSLLPCQYRDLACWQIDRQLTVHALTEKLRT